jgi:hypothetical protein
MSELPLTEKDKAHAKKMTKIEKRNQWANTRSKLIGLLLALGIILAITIGRIIIQLWR